MMKKKFCFKKKPMNILQYGKELKLSKEELYMFLVFPPFIGPSEMEEKLNELISNCDGVYLNKNIHVSRSASDVETRDDRFRKRVF